MGYAPGQHYKMADHMYESLLVPPSGVVESSQALENDIEKHLQDNFAHGESSSEMVIPFIKCAQGDNGLTFSIDCILQILKAKGKKVFLYTLQREKEGYKIAFTKLDSSSRRVEKVLDDSF